jgi:hypothetical protein
MITLLHGDNIEASRNELLKLKSQHIEEVREISGKNCTETILAQAVESHSLFDTPITIIIEQLFGPLGRKVKQAEVYTNILKKADPTVTILLWESKELGKEILGLFGSKIEVQLFTYPKILFTFLDSLKPNNTKTLIQLIIDLLKHEPAELLWNMCLSRIRTLISISSGITPAKMQTWQVGRLTNQSRSFTMDKLLDIYQKMLTMEYAQKSGMSPFSSSEMLVQWITEL